MNSNIPFWPSDGQAGKPLHPAVLKRPKICAKCGKGFLFWHKTNTGVPHHRLHHYADLNDGKGPRYILHRCGFTSAGKPIAASAPREGEG